MPYIYKITNKVNGKLYVGQTSLSLEERFKQHLQDSKKENIQHRPLYKAMQKYGPENFTIELLEETDNPNEREMYWIDKLDTYHSKNGYNASLGGEGKTLYPHKEILARLMQYPYPKDVAKEFGCSVDTVLAVAKAAGLQVKSKGYNNVNAPKKIRQFSKNGDFIQVFESVSDAAKWCEAVGACATANSGVRSHIGDVANGKRKTAYGYVWKYMDA